MLRIVVSVNYFNIVFYVGNEKNIDIPLMIGARCISCIGIRLCDIQEVTVLDTGECEIVIVIHHTKGSRSRNHPTRMRGKICSDPSNDNFIGHLELHLHNKFGLSLTDFTEG